MYGGIRLVSAMRGHSKFVQKPVLPQAASTPERVPGPGESRFDIEVVLFRSQRRPRSSRRQATRSAPSVYNIVL